MARARTRVFAPDRQKKEKASRFLRLAFIYAGNDLLSHTLSRAVQSALRGLTSVFGMGTGGTPAVRSPTNLQSLVVGSWWSALLANTFSDAKFQRQTFKERENGVSQLNRLGKRCRATSLTTSAFSARSRRSFLILLHPSSGEQKSVIRISPGSD